LQAKPESEKDTRFSVSSEVCGQELQAGVISVQIEIPNERGATVSFGDRGLLTRGSTDSKGEQIIRNVFPSCRLPTSTVAIFGPPIWSAIMGE